MRCLQRSQKPPPNYMNTNHTAWGSPHTDITTLLAEPIKYSNPVAASSNVSVESRNPGGMWYQIDLFQPIWCIINVGVPECPGPSPPSSLKSCSGRGETQIY